MNVGIQVFVNLSFVVSEKLTKWEEVPERPILALVIVVLFDGGGELPVTRVQPR